MLVRLLLRGPQHILQAGQKVNVMNRLIKKTGRKQKLGGKKAEVKPTTKEILNWTMSWFMIQCFGSMSLCCVLCLMLSYFASVPSFVYVMSFVCPSSLIFLDVACILPASPFGMSFWIPIFAFWFVLSLNFSVALCLVVLVATLFSGPWTDFHFMLLGFFFSISFCFNKSSPVV